MITDHVQYLGTIILLSVVIQISNITFYFHDRPEVHYKINENELPVNIEEHWRKLYIDCTNLNESKIDELINWLNIEQPIR